VLPLLPNIAAYANPYTLGICVLLRHACKGVWAEPGASNSDVTIQTVEVTAQLCTAAQARAD
jgi:hypothetical protein